MQKVRAERFELLATARRVLSAAGRAEGLVWGHDLHRTAKCKHILRGEGGVAVHLAREHGSAFYSGLATCGSVWSCPVCAAKVQERRREEIAQAIDWAYEQGLQPVMVTLTFPHRAWHELEQLLQQQADALHRLRAGAPWSRVKEWAGYRGLIRSLELTHGSNGWHPHTHELWFVRKDLDAQKLREKVLRRWKTACAKAGLLDLGDTAQVTAFEAHSVDVKGDCSTSDYLAKQDDSRHWGADREIAKASTKAGRAKGLHPFGLLDQARVGCPRSSELFVSYCLAMRGRRQLFWSHGLKAEVGVDEVSDEAIAEQDRETADEVCRLDADDWRCVLAAEARSRVLDAAENGGRAAVKQLVALLRSASGQRPGASVDGGRAPAPTAGPPPPAVPTPLFRDAHHSTGSTGRSLSGRITPSAHPRRVAVSSGAPLP
ncbi:MAG: protein rep [Burkholderiales bacterium]